MASCFPLLRLVHLYIYDMPTAFFLQDNSLKVLFVQVCILLLYVSKHLNSTDP